MIEILFTVYVSCLILSVLLLSWHYLTTQRQLRAPSVLNLNRNLSAVGLYWSHSNGAFASLDEGSVAEDRRKSLRNILWLSLLAFASLPGLLLLAAVIFSVRYLARSRLEVAVMESPLALQVGLKVQETQALVEQMKSSHGVR
jgi:hypothetical protein